jgi:L-malate glycosyltransferase
MIDQLSAMGGGEASLIKIVRHLPREKFRCSVVTLSSRVNAAIVAQLPCPLHVLPVRRAFGFNSLLVARQLRRLIRAERVDIVHTFFETANLWGGLVSKLGGGPALITSRRDMGILRRSLKHRLGYKIINRMCDRVVAVSNAVRDLTLEQESIRHGKTITLYNGVDLASISSTPADTQWRRNHGCAPADPVIASVGNIRRVKGMDTLIHSAALVCRELPRARFVIIGGDDEVSYARRLRQTIRSLDLERNIIFAGHSERVVPILKNSQAFCLLSRSEGFSNAILEAMACGLPCVVTGVGGNPEAVVNNVNGFVVPPDDPASAARCLVHLLRDRQGALAIGAAGKALVASRFTTEVMVSELGELYRQLVEG